MATDGEGIREINGQQVKVTPKTEDIIKKAEKDFRQYHLKMPKLFEGQLKQQRELKKCNEVIDLLLNFTYNAICPMKACSRKT